MFSRLTLFLTTLLPISIFLLPTDVLVTGRVGIPSSSSSRDNKFDFGKPELELNPTQWADELENRKPRNPQTPLYVTEFANFRYPFMSQNKAYNMNVSGYHHPDGNNGFFHSGSSVAIYTDYRKLSDNTKQAWTKVEYSLSGIDTEACHPQNGGCRMAIHEGTHCASPRHLGKELKSTQYNGNMTPPRSMTYKSDYYCHKDEVFYPQSFNRNTDPHSVSQEDYDAGLYDEMNKTKNYSLHKKALCTATGSSEWFRTDLSAVDPDPVLSYQDQFFGVGNSLKGRVFVIYSKNRKEVEGSTDASSTNPQDNPNGELNEYNLTEVPIACGIIREGAGPGFIGKSIYENGTGHMTMKSTSGSNHVFGHVASIQTFWPRIELNGRSTNFEHIVQNTSEQLKRDHPESYYWRVWSHTIKYDWSLYRIFSDGCFVEDETYEQGHRPDCLVQLRDGSSCNTVHEMGDVYKKVGSHLALGVDNIESSAKLEEIRGQVTIRSGLLQKDIRGKVLTVMKEGTGQVISCGIIP